MGPVRQGRRGRREPREGRDGQARRPDPGALQQVGAVEAAFEAACRSLAARRQSRDEVARKLARRGFAPDVAEAALDRAARLGFLDDAALAHDAARALAEGRLYGRRRIERTLRARGLGREAVEAAVDAATPGDPEAEATRARAALDRARRWPPPGDRDAHRRAAAYLARRGFDWDTIEAVLGAGPDS